MQDSESDSSHQPDLTTMGTSQMAAMTGNATSVISTASNETISPSAETLRAQRAQFHLLKLYILVYLRRDEKRQQFRAFPIDFSASAREQDKRPDVVRMYEGICRLREKEGELREVEGKMSVLGVQIIQ